MDIPEVYVLDQSICTGNTDGSFTCKSAWQIIKQGKKFTLSKQNLAQRQWTAYC